MSRWFLPRAPDVVALLQSQVEVTIQGMEAFAAWSAGEVELGPAIDEAEHRADAVRRQLLRELRSAFSTPLDAEDIYELSERLDAVLNAAKNAVREAEVMQIGPDEALGQMAAQALAGVRHLRDAFGALTSDSEGATAAADAATKCQRRIERIYRSAMSQLLEVNDLRAVIAWREMYRRFARIGEDMERVAERVWYAVVKER